jgi:proteasome lid subunit RPN8/RPN11
VSGDGRLVRISASTLDAMIEHARREAPNECCGMLVGRPSQVERSVPAKNVAAMPTVRYEVDPREHIALNRELRGSGQQVIGVYHSHPLGPARPSASDLAEAFYPDFIYVIVSLVDPLHAEVRAFEIAGGRANDMTIENASILRSFRSS